MQCFLSSILHMMIHVMVIDRHFFQLLLPQLKIKRGYCWFALATFNWRNNALVTISHSLTLSSNLISKGGFPNSLRCFVAMIEIAFFYSLKTGLIFPPNTLVSIFVFCDSPHLKKGRYVIKCHGLPVEFWALAPQPPPPQNISFIAQLWQNFCHQDQDDCDDDDYIV